MTLAAAASGSSAGPLGLLIILLIGVAMILLIRNMNGRLRRLPKSFDEQPDESRTEEPTPPTAP